MPPLAAASVRVWNARSAPIASSFSRPNFSPWPLTCAHLPSKLLSGNRQFGCNLGAKQWGSPHKPEHNLRTKPPKYRAESSSMTQIEARRFSYLAFLELSVGPRFKSWRAHQAPSTSWLLQSCRHELCVPQ